MSPAFGHHVGVEPLASQAGGKVPTTHGYPPSKPLEIMLIITIIFISLFQAR
jgi:hypothetical protein